MKYNKGVTLLEITIVVGILAIMVAIITPSFANFRNKQAVENTTQDLVSLLNEARTNTLLSKSSVFYSVHLETNRAVLFDGGTFDTNDSSNKVITFDTQVSVPSAGISLNGGEVDVSFDRLTGDTSDYGTIIVSLISNTSISKTITVNQLGVVSSN